MIGNDGNKSEPDGAGDRQRQDEDPAAASRPRRDKVGDDKTPPDGDTIAELGDALGGPA